MGAYRPFERGPRNCIEQGLAMLEGMVVLVSVARGFVFEKVGLTGRAVVDGGEQGREVWSEHAVMSVPIDEMVMRVSMSEKANLQSEYQILASRTSGEPFSQRLILRLSSESTFELSFSVATIHRT